jgi:hypothetical protein
MPEPKQYIINQVRDTGLVEPHKNLKFARDHPIFMQFGFNQITSF